MRTRNPVNFFISLVTMFAVNAAADSICPKKPVRADYVNVPLSFERNRGQTNEQVEFLAHGAGYNLFLSHAEAVLTFHDAAATVSMKPVGANTSAPPEPLDELPAKSSYFIGAIAEKWRTGIPNYAKVRYRNVYPGVDLIYYGNLGQLEYDFIVNPGADPRRILLDFQGATKAELNSQGDVVMDTEAGTVRWHKPVAYQEVDGNRQIVACAYVPHGERQLRLRLSAYDTTRALIIDPVLEYSTYLGGSGLDGGASIAVDTRGNAYVTGTVTSANFPAKNAFEKLRKNPSGTVFITKFDGAGKLVYSTYLGGSGSPDQFGDQGRGIAVDCRGNAYVTGFAVSRDFPIKNAFQPKLLSPNGEAFVTKLNASGDALVFSTYLGGTSGAFGNAIAVDVHDDAYVTGGTSSLDFPTTKDAFQETLRSQFSGAFVTKFNFDGKSLAYSTYLSGTGFDQGFGIAVDARGSAYVTGAAFSTDFPTKNAFQRKLGTSNGAANAFITKFNAVGTGLVYSTYLGGSGGDQGTGIAVDAHDCAYVTGLTSSGDFPTKGGFQRRLKGYTNAFVTKFAAAAGNWLVYSTYLGGSVNGFPGDSGTGIAVDKSGNAYVTGTASSVDFPRRSMFQEELKSSAGNAFVTKLDLHCELVYSSYLGGSGIAGDAGAGIAVDVHGNAYVTGGTGSTNFPTKNAFQITNRSKGDPINPGHIGNVFVTKISAR